MPDENLIFIKFGGSLITDKDTPNTVQGEIISNLAAEIKRASEELPELKFIIGHGSGSFGHTAGDKYQTRAGVSTSQEWEGFLEVWQAAHALGQIVLEHCQLAGLPVIVFPPSASVTTTDRKFLHWNIDPLIAALNADLIPLVMGDVVFDQQLGGTILSTEELFVYLAQHLQPCKILLASIEPGVWEDYPDCKKIIPHITNVSPINIINNLQGSASIDVTGGMKTKVELMLKLSQKIPGLQSQIFSAKDPDNLYQAILGSSIGTLINN
ncbi:MAG: isopentenyl phosphate kinase [Chloroflexota bacterium]